MRIGLRVKEYEGNIKLKLNKIIYKPSE